MIIFQTNPIVTEGNRSLVDTINFESDILLTKILDELRKMNLHMSLMTDTDIKISEIEEIKK
jgi:hypothetical protein